MSWGYGSTGRQLAMQKALGSITRTQSGHDDDVSVTPSGREDQKLHSKFEAGLDYMTSWFCSVCFVF